jgi:glycosyltransferase involved in cell wall biosynthesis
MKIGVVHDWLPLYGGAEHVVSAIMQTVGPADLYTIFDFLSVEDRERIGADHIITSYLNRLPLCKNYYRWTFPFCPTAIESFDLSEYDLVLSSSAAFAKGVIVHPHQHHIAYVHSSIRYAWDQTFEYMDSTSLSRGLSGALLRLVLHNLRMWDTRTANGPDVLVANSTTVQRRIEQVYGRFSIVLPPPVDTVNFPMCSDKDDYFVVASRLVSYKRIDLIVDAFKEMPNRRLLVLGDGPEMKRLKLHAGPNVMIKGHVSRKELVDVVSHAKAFIFASYEDFGIVMAEAQAAGTPVLAFQRGGALDIVRTDKTECPTGMFFAEQSTGAIKDVVERFILQQGFFTPQACSENARRFSIENFCSRLTEIIDVTLDPYFNRDLRILPATNFPTAGPRTAEPRRLYLGDRNRRPTQASGHGDARTYNYSSD